MFLFNNLKIRAKIITVIVLGYILTLTVGLIGKNYIEISRDRLQKSYEQGIVPAKMISKLNIEMGYINAYLRDVYYSEEIKYQKFAWEKIDAGIDDLKEISLGYRDILKIQDNTQGKEYSNLLIIYDEIVKIEGLVQELKEIIDSGDRAKAKEKLEKEVAPGIDTINLIAENLVEDNAVQTKFLVDDYIESLDVGETIVLTVLSIGTIIIILASIFSIHSIMVPIRELLRISKDVAKGRLNINVKSKNNDELGELCSDFKTVVSTLDNLIVDLNAMIKEHGAGDIDFRINTSKYEGAYAEVAEGINFMVNDYITMIEEMFVGFEHISSGDFHVKIKEYPGKKRIVTEKIGDLAERLKTVQKDIIDLVNHGNNGDLATRVDTSKYKGDWKKLLEGINELMDSFSVPIYEARRVLLEISEGNLSVAMTGEYKGDFAIIKTALNDTVVSIQGYIKDIENVLGEIANNNLDVSIDREYVGDFFLIKESLSTIIKKLNTVMGEINSAAEHVSAGAGLVSESSMVLAEGTTEQASAVEQLSATVETIDYQTKTNAQIAQKANDLSDSAKENALKGNDEMRHMLVAMESINESSNNISNVIKVIDDIAFQTNLLALNAAVEAARAGTYGRGFAVVAEEVRNLAVSCREAAKETTVLIEDSIVKVTEGGNLAAKTAMALEQIVEDISKISDYASEISDASIEQEYAVNQITVGLGQISQVVQKNSASSEEGASSSEELSSQSEMLREMISVFRLKSR